MQLYIASRPMFMDVEVMNKDAKTVEGAGAGAGSLSDMINGLSVIYEDISGRCTNQTDASGYVFRY